MAKSTESQDQDIKALAAAVCKQHAKVFIDPFDWSLEETLDEKHKRPREAAAAAEFFLDWGQGYFENEVFVLHGYTYDDTCRCGSWDNDFPAELEHLFDKAQKDDARLCLCVCNEGCSDYFDRESPVILPRNFVHKPTNTSLEWYKRIGRGTVFTGRARWDEVIEDCSESIATGACFAEIKDWPINKARAVAHEEVVKKAIADPERFIKAVQQWNQS